MGMGIIIRQSVFTGIAPGIERITAKIEEIGGQPLVITKRQGHQGELRELDVDLAFDGFPDSKINLYIYRPGAVKVFMRSNGTDTMPHAERVEGFDDPPGQQTVYLRGFAGQETTLFFLTEIALESLGGQPCEPLTEDFRREFGRAFSRPELERLHKDFRKSDKWALLLVVIAFPWIVLLGIFYAIWTIITLPWRLIKIMRAKKMRG